jgi:RNA polymerase sigma-70 factor (ECF subfamily)
LWNSIEPIRWNLFQTPLPIAAAYAFCWWATRGRQTRRVAVVSAVFVLMLAVGRLFVPANIFVRGTVVNGASGEPVPHAELFLANSQPAEKTNFPNTRSRVAGKFDLYVPWYSAGTQLRIEAPGFKTLVTELEPLRLGAKSVSRDFKLQVELPLVTPTIPPVVVGTLPESGAAEVSPGLTELRVTFSMPMIPGQWSWVKLGNAEWPELTGEPRFLENMRTCVVPVRLQPGTTYALWLNVDQFQLFQGTNGVPSVPYLLVFKTRDRL